VGHGLRGLMLNECTDAGRNVLCLRPYGCGACIGNHCWEEKICDGQKSTLSRRWATRSKSGSSAATRCLTVQTCCLSARFLSG